MRTPSYALTLFLATAAIPALLAAQSVLPAHFEAPEQALRAESGMVSSGPSLDPSAILQPAALGALDGLDSIRVWNRAGRLPTRNGFSRPLPLPQALRVSAADRSVRFESRAGGVYSARDDGSRSWTTTIRVEQSHRLRLHLTGISPETPLLFWVHSSDGESVGPFGRELVDEGELWTPSVAGEEITLEARIPERLLSQEARTLFTVDRLLEVVRLNGEGLPIAADSEENASCLRDATCYNSGNFKAYNQAITAVAHLQYVKSGEGYICTGTLINDNDDSSFIPYFLTANHCISSQKVAATLESFFDYRSRSCGGNAPSLGSLPRVSGSTLMTTAPVTDFTLLRLTSLPPRAGYLMGWHPDPAQTGPGRTLYRISHPLGFSQGYSETTVPANVTRQCSPDEDGRPWNDYSRFVYQNRKVGGTLGGSSGGASMNNDGQIVGQLLGACGQDLENSCSSQNNTVDGRFSATYPFVEPYLFGTSNGPCFSTGRTACQVNRRFEITTAYDLGNGQTGSLGLNSLNDNSTLGHFTNPNNVEVLGKVLNGCGINGFYWVAIAGLTDREVIVRVRDTKNGRSKVYSNPLGTLFQSKFDIEAFPCN